MLTLFDVSDEIQRRPDKTAKAEERRIKQGETRPNRVGMKGRQRWQVNMGTQPEGRGCNLKACDCALHPSG